MRTKILSITIFIFTHTLFRIAGKTYRNQKLCIYQVMKTTGINDVILLLNLFPEDNVENQRVMTGQLLSPTDLANHVPETVGHIYPVMQGDVSSTELQWSLLVLRMMMVG